MVRNLRHLSQQSGVVVAEASYVFTAPSAYQLLIGPQERWIIDLEVQQGIDFGSNYARH